VNFRVLPSQLHTTAEEVARFLREERGLSRFRVEEPVDDEVDYRPTLQTTTPEFHDVWIEVSELPYLRSLDSVVLHCVTNSLPVKLYVAFPQGLAATEYKVNIDEARRKGVGAIEITGGKCHVIHEATPLSLGGVRSEDHKKFPARYRSSLSTAETTFRNGDAAKGSSIVYDDIENLSRRLAKKIHNQKLWKPKASGPPATNFDKDAWATIMDLLLNRAELTKLPNKINKNLLIRVAAMIEARNDAGHKPKTRADRIRRDRESRTRFETAVDVLRDFADATRPLRI
jgi:hypothetical protein